jgi:hypothetical protein
MSGSGAWTRTKILGSKGPCATNCTTPESQGGSAEDQPTLTATNWEVSLKSWRRNLRSPSSEHTEDSDLSHASINFGKSGDQSARSVVQLAAADLSVAAGLSGTSCS